MLGRFAELKNYRQSLFIIVVLVFTMISVSFVYKYKIEEIMVSALKQQIVLKSKGELEAVNHNFNRIISVLNLASLSISKSISKGDYIGSARTAETINDITRVSGFLDIGITDLQGEVLYGFKLDDQDIAKLKKIYVGKTVVTVTVSKYGGNYDVLIAVPVYVNQSYVRYALYIKATGDELIRYFNKYTLYNDGVNSSLSFLLYNMYDVVHINEKTQNRLLPKYTVRELLDSAREKNNISIRQKQIQNQVIDNLYVFQGNGLPAHYMSIIKLPYDGWSFVYMIPASELDDKIRAIMTMFGFLIIGTMVILTILLVYYEYTVESNRKKVYNLAYFDEFTGLPNRVNLRANYEEVYESTYQNKIEEYYLATVIISNFHILHNLYGTEITNRFEQKLASCMKHMENSSFTPYKGNNSYYAIIRAESKSEVEIILRKLFASAQSIDGIEYRSLFKAGVCSFTASSMPSNIDDIMDKCSIALYDHEDENVSQNSIVFFVPEMQEEIIRQNNLEKELIPAIYNGEFLVYLQPKYDLNTNRLSGAEALIRWNYKLQRLLPPGQFIPVFEKNGSIANIDNFIFVSILDLLKKWKDLGYRLVPISVNFSQVQFRNPNLLRDLKERIRGYEDIIRYIDIEITESSTIDSQDTVLEILNELKKIGFKLSMDDFGTGYSCLSNISLYPFDTIKLDKSFVDKIDVNNRNSPDVMLVSDVIQITKHFGIHSLVEGVENIDQKNILRDLGCEYCQGYYYSAPLPLAEFERILGEDKIFEDWR
jgi:EAL domain-containing protein (putative c-di-GMP-specific phosphodiesterase class I)/GGDEF domain-containing protein